MEIHDLLLTLLYEVQKTFDFVDRSNVGSPSGASPIHMTLETVEVELPIAMSGKEVTFSPGAFKGQPKAVKRLYLPYSEKAAMDKQYVPRKQVSGRTVVAEIVGPTEKLDEQVVKERLGRIRVVMKPIVK